MYNDKRILAVIPARGGSKGIPHKNIISLCRKPLISYTIETSKNSRYIDYIMVSTDDEEIAKVSKKYGADIPFMRPAELASDTSKTVDVVIHVIDELKKRKQLFDVLVLLQPTAPLRTSADIDNAIEKYFECKCDSLASVSEVDDNPILIRSIENDKLQPLLHGSSTCRRQDMAKYFKINGCIYINEISKINTGTSFNDNRIPFLMEKSHCVDIDELSDLALAEFYINNKAGL